MGFSWHYQKRVVYLTSDLLAASGGVKHAFSTRHGGPEQGRRQFRFRIKKQRPGWANKLRRLFLETVESDLIILWDSRFTVSMCSW